MGIVVGLDRQLPGESGDGYPHSLELARLGEKMLIRCLGGTVMVACERGRSEPPSCDYCLESGRPMARATGHADSAEGFGLSLSIKTQCPSSRVFV